MEGGKTAWIRRVEREKERQALRTALEFIPAILNWLYSTPSPDLHSLGPVSPQQQCIRQEPSTGVIRLVPLRYCQSAGESSGQGQCNI